MDPISQDTARLHWLYQWMRGNGLMVEVHHLDGVPIKGGPVWALRSPFTVGRVCAVGSVDGGQASAVDVAAGLAAQQQAPARRTRRGASESLSTFSQDRSLSEINTCASFIRGGLCEGVPGRSA